ncbi:uncharacterized protein N7482_001027 [Penicillium canariense]|uniref:Uncharacterized protein n=1 Tax=Penicillium canariense TaxID=189055 RepID=A0A9W9IFS2_9EURO|nr:uncharacterized protein N7482_001027 [Penicillium canariense]KAJ5175150.1 hypothetical protein N7482_001027 [Penicillium canariense]
MKLSYVASVLVLAAGALAKLHDVAVCVSNRKITQSGGSPYHGGYTWEKSYEILEKATQCACDYYKQRNTGNNQWDHCPDCTFDGTYCRSAGWHIGGNEMNYYCEQLCHAQGSEGS